MNLDQILTTLPEKLPTALYGTSLVNPKFSKNGVESCTDVWAKFDAGIYEVRVGFTVFGGNPDMPRWANKVNPFHEKFVTQYEVGRATNLATAVRLALGKLDTFAQTLGEPK